MKALKYSAVQIKKWRKNIRIILAFMLLFIYSFSMSFNYADYANLMGLTIGIFEPFIALYTQPYSLVTLSLLFLMIYQDVPFIDNSSPYFLIRGSRVQWIIGNFLYILFSVCIFLLFSLIVCSIAGARMAYTGNVWSETAVFTSMGGGIGKYEDVLPISTVLINKLTMYESAFYVFVLFVLGSLLLNILLFVINLWKGKYVGIGAVSFLLLIGYVASLQIYIPGIKWISIQYHTNLVSHLANETGSQINLLTSVFVLIIAVVMLLLASIPLSKQYAFFSEERIK